MDPVTHLAVGALGGQALRKPLRRDKHVLVFCLLAAWLPDIDNFIGILGPEFYLIHHRGLTHSFLGAILLAALFVWIFRWFVPSFSFIRGFVLVYLLIALHIFLDLITSYGTQIFFPFTNARYAVTSVFIIDPIYTLVMLFCMYRSAKYLKTRKTLALLGLAWVFIYPAFNLGVRYGLEYYLEQRFVREGVAFNAFDVSTDVLSPFFWKVIVDQGDAYQLGGVNVFKLRQPLTFTRYEKADNNLFREFGQISSLFATYHWFFDFPIMRTEQIEKETLITFGDLRFATAAPFLQHQRNNDQLPFTLTMVLDEQQKPVRYQYQRRGREQVVLLIE
ncbi:membrane-bound metal-dependent hydrolase [Candidatus Vecturithrix granuli]|uniref:Membrane-bound metal-dependent hydrolase n=1 Tax=Vecturithrix granuli TaxID=1499967 RepID=A0A081BW50_VECG1|nr:membrane-bound metal-dependent hydrolase [Candidatus Vecturithrix granuli]